MPIAFKYILPFQRNTTTLTYNVYNETQVFYFLVKNLELSITSHELVNEGLLDMGQRSYHALSAVSLQSGERFTITISGLAKRTRRKQVLIFSGVVVLVLTIIGAFVFRKGRGENAAKSEVEEMLLERKNVLVSTIALLDERHEKGEISEHVYHKLRSEHKEKLQRIIEVIGESKPKNDQD
jgi:hypothetical protein